MCGRYTFFTDKELQEVDDILEKISNEIQFEKMKTDYHKNISEQAVFGRVPFLSKRRSKKFL